MLVNIEKDSWYPVYFIGTDTRNKVEIPDVLINEYNEIMNKMYTLQDKLKEYYDNKGTL